MASLHSLAFLVAMLATRVYTSLVKSQYLFLLREFVRRDFKGRYAGSALGFVWSFVQPLWSLLLFTFVFSVVLKISPIGERTDDFAVFLFCGLLPWMAIQEGISRSTTAITDNAQLVNKVSFPSELLVLSVVSAALLHQAIAAVVFMVVLALMGTFTVHALPILFVAIPLQLALTVGLGLLLAAVNVFVRDTSQIQGMVFTGWFYFTPIVYPLSLVPERFRIWLEFNPMTTLVTLYREAFLGGDLGFVAGTGRLAVVACAMCAFGWLVFHRLKPVFSDEI
ncbi:MAG: ABC transporter permease [bacterium]|nr:ABC transporter permease [bacterium]